MAPANKRFYSELWFNKGTSALVYYDGGNDVLVPITLGTSLAVSVGNVLDVTSSGTVTSSAGGTSGGEIAVFTGGAGTNISRGSYNGVLEGTSGILSGAGWGSAGQIYSTATGGASSQWRTLSITNTGTTFAWSLTSGSATVNIPPASGTNAGTVSTGVQTFAGQKTFSGQVVLATGTTVLAPLFFPAGTLKTTAAAGEMEYDGTTVYFTNGGSQRQEIILSQQSRVTTQFDKTSNTTLGNVTGLTATLVAGKTYRFEANLFVVAGTLGGTKYAIAGTATATAIIYEVHLLDNSSNLNTITSKQTALAGSVGQAGTTDGFVRIKGLITVNAAGTLTVQFAQNSSNGTASSVLVGSTFVITQIA